MESQAKSLPDVSCVVKVGDGRGFVIEHRWKLPELSTIIVKRCKLRPRRFAKSRLVVTVAHCMGEGLPPAHPASFSEERMYRLLGSLDGSNHDIWAECLFVDPVADIAVLGRPDDQAFGQEADAYCALTGDVSAVGIDQARNGPGWVLTLDGHWTHTTLEVLRGRTHFGLTRLSPECRVRRS